LSWKALALSLRAKSVNGTPELFYKSKTKKILGPSLSKAALMVNPWYFPSLEV